MVDVLLVLISLIIDLSFDLFTKRLHVLLHSPINPFVYQLLNPSPHGLRNVLKIILIHLLVGPGLSQLFGSLPLFLNHGFSMQLLVFLKFLTSIIQFLLSIDSAFVNLIYSSPNLLVVKHRQRPLGEIGCAVRLLTQVFWSEFTALFANLLPCQRYRVCREPMSC